MGMYKMEDCSNVEVEFKWIRLGLAAKWDKAVQPALRLATVQGRMKFVRPLYRDLYGRRRDSRQSTLSKLTGLSTWRCAPTWLPRTCTWSSLEFALNKHVMMKY